MYRIKAQQPSCQLLRLTFCSSLEENLAAATGERTVMAAGRLVRTDQARPLRWKEELHGERVLSASLKPAVKHIKHGASTVQDTHVGCKQVVDLLLMTGIRWLVTSVYLCNHYHLFSLLNPLLMLPHLDESTGSLPLYCLTN